MFTKAEYSFAFLQIGKIIGLTDAQLLKGHGGIVDLLFHTLVVEYYILLFPFLLKYVLIIQCSSLNNSYYRKR